MRGKKNAGAAPRFTKLFFATDLHGSDRAFRKFVNAGALYGADVLILGGDVTGKALVPIVEDGDGCYRAAVSDVRRVARTREELEELRALIAGMGFYHELLGHEEYERLREDPDKVEELFAVKARERLLQWITHADERLAGTRRPLYMTGGNDDAPWVVDVLNTRQTERVVNPEGKVVLLDAIHRMVSVGFSNPTPWRTPREVDEDTLRGAIEASVAGIGDFRNVVFNFHAPPRDCTLDHAPLLDQSSSPPRPVVRAGRTVMTGVGSVAVREAIERFQPLLALVGHIHESRGIVRIGRTAVINPGSEYGEGILRGVVVNIEDGNILGYQFTSG